MKQLSKSIQRILITIIILLFCLLIYLYRNIILDFLILIVSFLGTGGIFIISFLLDVIFFQPISPSVFLVLVLLTEQYNWYWILFLLSFGSLCGSIFDYFMGKYYGEKIFGFFLSKNKLKKVEELFKKYSHYAILIGAFTPVPYALICWFAGTSNVSFKKFILLAPIARMTLFFCYCMLVQYGLPTFLL